MSKTIETDAREAAVAAFNAGFRCDPSTAEPFADDLTIVEDRLGRPLTDEEVDAWAKEYRATLGSQLDARANRLFEAIENVAAAPLEDDEDTRQAAGRHWATGGALLVMTTPSSGHCVITLEDDDDPWVDLDEFACAPRGQWEDVGFPRGDATCNAFVIAPSGRVEHVAGLATWRDGLELWKGEK